MLYDKDIREPLAFYLEEIYGKNRILEEQVMGQSRADMVMVVYDALYGIEIWSWSEPGMRHLLRNMSRNGGGSLRWNR